MLVPSIAYLSYTAAFAVNIQTVALLVGATFGPSAVVAVNATRTLTRFGVTIAYAVNHTLESVYAQLLGRHERVAFSMLYRHQMFAMAICNLVYLSGFLLFGDRVLALWTRNRLSHYDSLLLLMTVAAAAEIVWSSLQTPYVATNRHTIFAAWFLVLSISGIGANWLLLGRVGVSSVGWVSAGVAIVFLMVTIFKMRSYPVFPPERMESA